MTRKAKRAAALRKMEHAEAQNYLTGGIVDESFPAEAVHAELAPVADRIDLAAFDEFFGPRLGQYRMMSEARQQPSVAEELALVGETMEAIDQVRLRLEHIPPNTDAHLNLICFKRRWELFDDFRQRLDSDLKEAWNMLGLAERELELHKGKPGRRDASLRDCLLRDVADWLKAQCGRNDTSLFVAAEVLRAVNIPVPVDSREIRRRVQMKKNSP